MSHSLELLPCISQRPNFQRFVDGDQRPYLTGDRAVA